MINKTKHWLFLPLMLLAPGMLIPWGVAAQSSRSGYDENLRTQMLAYELNVENTYREYLKLYYEDKRSGAELLAFEHLLAVYVDQVLEMFDTFMLAGGRDLDQPRDVAARCLIFRALTYLEKAPLHPEYFERACYDYYAALDLYRGISQVPVVIKDLPRELFVENKNYTRLIDLLDEKGQSLYDFGRLEVTFRGLKVTSELEFQTLEFLRTSSRPGTSHYTYDKAKETLNEAFKQALGRGQGMTYSLALPEGTYVIRSKSLKDPRYVTLATIHVLPNQQLAYFVEPMSDWVIFYENPNSSRPESRLAQASNSHRETGAPAQASSGTADDEQFVANGMNFQTGQANLPAVQPTMPMDPQTMVRTITHLVEECYKTIDSSALFSGDKSVDMSKFREAMATRITSEAQSPAFYNHWSKWTMSWSLAKEITQHFARGTRVTMELVRMLHCVVSSL